MPAVPGTECFTLKLTEEVAGMETADAVVIGGGINGVSIAHSLARRGAGKVVLLDKGGIAAGASGKTGGMVPPEDAAALRGIVGLQRELGAEAREISHEDLRELAQGIDLEGVGAIA